jgi:probable lipoprotein NlpC
MMIPVKDLVGIPYKEHGRDSTGMDCYGLVIEAIRRMGKTVPDAFCTGKGIKTKTASIPNTKLDKPEEGAVVEMLVMGRPSHIGVCLGDGTFIHAIEKIGVAIEPLSRYRHKIKGYYRVNN